MRLGAVDRQQARLFVLEARQFPHSPVVVTLDMIRITLVLVEKPSALPKELVLPHARAAHLATVRGSAFLEEEAAFLFFSLLFVRLELVDFRLHSGGLVALVKGNLVGRLEGCLGLLGRFFGLGLSLPGSLELLVPELHSLLCLLRQGCLRLRLALRELLIGLLRLPRAHHLCASFYLLELVRLLIRKRCCLVSKLLCNDPHFLGSLGLLLRILQRGLCRVQVFFAVVDTFHSRSLLRLRPLEAAVIQAFGRLALAVVLRLHHARTTLLAARRILPARAPTLVKRRDERALVFVCLEQPAQLRAHSSWPNTGCQCNDGKHSQRCAQRHASLSPRGCALARPQGPLLGLREFFEEELADLFRRGCCGHWV
mmetsp:Transcript_62198/g.144706  ORF Transcript_62198/g.144706 Transcript_62198/m.144706 type:complete len:369 (+) Transcript_62198:515-1621(+)